MATFGSLLVDGVRGAYNDSRVFHIVVVEEFISNPETLTDDEKSDLGRLGNNNYIDKMPRNCILGRCITNGTKGLETEVYYPFFSSHLCLPVKPGEQVWVIFEKLPGKGDEAIITLGYWISRRTSNIQIEDVNYSHQPRNTIEDGEDSWGSFPEGGRASANQNDLAGSGYGGIWNSSLESGVIGSQFIGEPVPRFTKRAPDFTIQGSNNTMITLGTERSGSLAKAGFAAVTDDEFGAGAIDIVAGRSYIVNSVWGDTVDAGLLITSTTLEDVSGSVSPAAGVDPNFSLPLAVGTNDRNFKEVIKDSNVEGSPTLGAAQNPLEGDPDFANDLSRIYISMKTQADTLFSIGQGETVDAAVAGTDYLSTIDGPQPAIVIKTDEARIIARDSLKIIVGKETEGAAVVLKSDGNIIFVPGSGGVIKLGGDDADRAILMTDGTQTVTNADGTVTAIPISTTAGGTVGNGEASAFGQFSTKVLIK